MGRLMEGRMEEGREWVRWEDEGVEVGRWRGWR